MDQAYFSQPTTTIRADGTWTCDITTGGIDHLATEIAAFLVPASFQPPVAIGTRDIPAEVRQSAVAEASASRASRSRFIPFSGYQWQVKTTRGVRSGPGPNYFSDEPGDVFVDSSGRLHLKVTRKDAQWHCAEVIGSQSLGFGRYTFVIEGGFERMDQNAVLGLFLWDAGAPEHHHREIDIEFSRWGVSNNQNAQSVVQTYTTPGNIFRFEMAPAPVSTHSFDWREREVQFESTSSFGQPTWWDYTGPSVPPPANENPRNQPVALRRSGSGGWARHRGDCQVVRVHPLERRRGGVVMRGWILRRRWGDVCGSASLLPVAERPAVATLF